jgi:hypothetical protein
MNARILGNAITMQRQNDQKFVSRARAKTERECNHLVVVAKQCPPLPKPALVTSFRAIVEGVGPQSLGRGQCASRCNMHISLPFAKHSTIVKDLSNICFAFHHPQLTSNVLCLESPNCSTFSIYTLKIDIGFRLYAQTWFWGVSALVECNLILQHFQLLVHVVATLLREIHRNHINFCAEEYT